MDYLNFRRDVFRNKGTLNKGLITITDQAIVSVGSFITSIIVARACNKDEFGLYALGLTIVIFALSLQSSLITLPYMICIPKLKEIERSVFTGSTFIHQLMLSLTSALVLMSVSFLFLKGRPQMIRVMSAVAGVIPFILIKEYIRSISLARLRTNSVLLFDILILSGQVGGILLLASHGVLSGPATFLIIGISSGMAGISLVIWRYHWFSLRIQESRTDLVRNLELGRWLLASSFTYAFSKEIYPWMLTFFHSPAATASFAACLAVVFISNPLVIGLGNFLGPLANHVYADEGKENLFSLIRKSTLFVIVVMGLFCAVLFIFGENIVTIIYGSKYSGNGLLICTLALSVFASVSTFPIGIGLYALERPDIPFKACLCSLVVTISIGILLVKNIGPLGAALSVLIGNIFESLFKYYKFLKIVNFNVVSYEKR